MSLAIVALISIAFVSYKLLLLSFAFFLQVVSYKLRFSLLSFVMLFDMCVLIRYFIIPVSCNMFSL